MNCFKTEIQQEIDAIFIKPSSTPFNVINPDMDKLEELNFYSDLLNTQENLCEELSSHILNRRGGKDLLHPLLCKRDYNEQFNAILNHIFYGKIRLQRSLLENRDFDTYLFSLYEPKDLVIAFQVIEDLLTDEDYWTGLRKVWRHSENVLQNHKIWFRLLTSDRRYKYLFMDEDERQAFDNLPDEIDLCTQYTGGQRGLLYSLSGEEATQYVQLCKPPEPKKLKIKKKDTFACLHSAGCETIIVLKTIDL